MWLMKKLSITLWMMEGHEAEEENTLELQKFGWQAIMDNFKNYSESSQ